MMCRCLDVSTSGFYAWACRTPGPRARDNAACEGFFGLLKRERVHHRRYRTRDEARADLLDYLERFHNPRMRRRVTRRNQEFSALTQQSVEIG